MEQLAQRKKKIVIGVSGASGTIYAICFSSDRHPVTSFSSLPLQKQIFVIVKIYHGLP